jgi:hypothetical protein
MRGYRIPTLWSIYQRILNNAGDMGQAFSIPLKNSKTKQKSPNSLKDCTISGSSLAYTLSNPSPATHLNP